MALIYKFTNKINGQAYIGKTIRPLYVRYNEHRRDCKKYLKDGKNNNIPLYNAVGSYGGWHNFTLEIIEKDIPLEEIDKKEQYYISLYNTYNDGYNATLGGEGGRTSSKLNDDAVSSIIQMLLDENNLLSIPQIATYFDINPSVISCINCGKAWYNDALNYPLRKYSVVGLTIDKNTYAQITDEIKNSDTPLKEIATKYNLSEAQMTAINNGYECYDGTHPYYLSVYKGPFPIRITNKRIDISNNLQEILYDIIFTKDSMAKIGTKYNLQGNTLMYIANGQRRKELTQDFITPLRKNILINQEIYNKKYNQKEGD